MSICLLLGGWGGSGFPGIGLSAHADMIHPNKTGSDYVRITGDDPDDERSHWDNLFNTATYVYGTQPFPFLKENIGLLPVGQALDLASAEGRNSVFLAKKGFRVTAVDYSEVALQKAQRLAHENHVSIKTVNADLTEYQIKPDTYNVILDIDFLQRSLIPQIKRGLKHGGIVVYVGETVDQIKNEKGKSFTRRERLLRKDELKELFKDFKILVYRETNDGKEAFANLIARKP